VRQSRVRYVYTFFTYLWRLRGSYDAVFVHMNEEYMLLGGWWWKWWGVPVFLWRNHYAGSWKTRIAGAFAKKVFYTSQSSFTASFAHSVRMPVGVDTSRFEHAPATRVARSILFLGRCSPSKRPHVLLEALAQLHTQGVEFTASFYGPQSDIDARYVEGLHKKAGALNGRVQIRGPVSHDALGPIYAAHDVFVNLSDPGMYDKTLFEAALSGCRVLATSPDFNALHGVPGLVVEPVAETLSVALRAQLEAPEATQEEVRLRLRSCAKTQSLAILAEQLAAEMCCGSDLAYR
jgi:glycosyltransferase involved in cell wall biosynthesis